MAPSYRENKLTLDGQMTTSKKHRKILHLTLGDTMDCTVNPPGQNTGVGSHSLLQQIFPTQELNQGLLRCRWILYQLSHQESPQKHRNSPWKRVWNPIMKPGKESSSSALGNCEKDLWANWLEDRRGMARNFVQQLNREWGTRRLLTNTGRKRGHR